MGFRGEKYAFDSPSAAVAGMIARLGAAPAERAVEARGIENVRGRILAEDVAADRDSPPFDYSSMDGYAVRAAKVMAGVTLRLVGESRIGCAPPVMPEGPGAVRIVTGAAIPIGADAVIKREDVVEHAADGADDRVGSVSIAASGTLMPRAGDFIRRRGENARAGEAVLGAGAVVSGAALGVLAAVGRSRVSVFRRLRVAIVTTGDELVAPGAAPGAFEIRDSNGPAVSAILGARAWIEVAGVTHVRDDGAALTGALSEAIEHAGAVIVTGGVSVGHRDPVRGAVERIGGKIVFHGLPQRPGKPMLGAVTSRKDGACVPVFGLPGNPISSMVTSERIVVPVLAALAGVERWTGAARVALAGGDGATIELWWHRLVRINADGDAELVSVRGSGDVVAGGRGDGFIEVPPGSREGARYPFYPWPM